MKEWSRKISAYFALIIKLFFVMAVITVSSTAEEMDSSYKAAEVFVAFTDSALEEDKAKLARELNLQELRRIQHLNLILYETDQPEDIQSIIDRAQEYPFVKYAEPNYYREQSAVDPALTEQWFLDNQGQVVNDQSGPADVDIDWTEARSIFSHNQTVTVAVLDTGVALDHPDLTDSIWVNTDEIFDNGVDDDSNGYVDDRIGWDFVDGDNFPLDQNGHGTLVAGTVAGAQDNGILGAGVAPESKIMSLRILDDFGEGRSFTTTVNLFIASTTYAANNGAKIINASFGGSPYSNAELSQIYWLKGQGVLLVIAAGNGGIDSRGDNNDTSPTYPASYDADNIISVAAIDRSNYLSSFSNFGASTVDIAAPGTDIYGPDVSRSYTYYEDFEGSFSGWLQGHLGDSQSTLDWTTFVDRIAYHTWISDSVDLLGDVINYMPNTNSFAESPWITIPFDGAQLEYRIYYELEGLLFDELFVEITVDDLNWYIIDYHTGFSYDISTLGSTKKKDIPSSLEGLQIKVRFRLQSDYSFQYDGAYIDHLALSAVDLFSWDGRQYQYSDGTSFSAPIVAGVAALVWAHRPGLSMSQVRSAILESAVVSSGLSGKLATNGAVNAYGALIAAEGMSSDSDGDGVTDASDLCADTAVILSVDANGCADEQVDTDDDSYCNPGAPSIGPSMCSGSDDFPSNPAEWNDNDNDGVGDNADPDDDNDNIEDDIDGQPLTANNNCTSGTADNATFAEVVIDDRQCAANLSIDVLSPAAVQQPGRLLLISPRVSFQPGFSASSLRVISADPCPSC